MDERQNNEHDDNNRKDVYSKLFIVCSKTVTEEELREVFSRFGTIEELVLPLDRNTRRPKGIAYIKFTKTSEAANALETMNNMHLRNSKYPLIVKVCNDRSDIQSDNENDSKYKRLFITHSKDMEENELHEVFNKFGKVVSVNVQRDWNSGDPKGFAYITYNYFSEAAYAFENCEKKYRAVFAVPKNQNKRQSTLETDFNSLVPTPYETSMTSIMNVRHSNYFRVNFKCHRELTHMEIQRLFDIVPGFIDCKYYIDLFQNCGKGTVTYSNPTSAAYAVEKLDGFEYPLGFPIIVMPDTHKFGHNVKKNKIPAVVNNLKNAIAVASSSSTPDLVQLAEVIAEASKLIKTATGMSSGGTPDSNDLNYCSVKLPPPRPLVDIDSPVAKRCFLICKPQPPPLAVLRDVFCRFGNLISVYAIPNKTVGFARYSTIESADAAIKTLHGAELCGIRIKVVEAEEEQPPSKKSKSQ